jgi:hypothetical protein
MTTYELAQAMVRLGAQTAVGLAFGKAVTAAFDGRLLSRPADRLGVPVKEALLLQYTGVYAPPVSLPAVGADSRSQAEQLSYKVVRPSNVTASVVAPDGTVHTIDSGDRQPGTYTFSWGAYDVEGNWTWSVKATDDLGRVSEADQPFRYDLTLSALRVPKTSRKGADATFTLSRPASVGLRIETSVGTVVATTPPVSLDPGAHTLAWDGKTAAGAAAPAGAYVVDVVATSTVGTSDLSAPVTLAG